MSLIKLFLKRLKAVVVQSKLKVNTLAQNLWYWDEISGFIDMINNSWDVVWLNFRNTLKRHGRVVLNFGERASTCLL